MGSFHQRFDRDKLKEIFRTHWGSFKEQFSRYRASRYDEVVKKMLGWEHPPNPNNRRNLWCSFWFWHPTPCPRLAIRAFYNHLGNLRCGLQRFSTAGRKCSIPIPIGKRSRTCRQQEWLCRVLKGIAEVESEMQKPVIIFAFALIQTATFWNWPFGQSIKVWILKYAVSTADPPGCSRLLPCIRQFRSRASSWFSEHRVLSSWCFWWNLFPGDAAQVAFSPRWQLPSVPMPWNRINRFPVRFADQRQLWTAPS